MRIPAVSHCWALVRGRPRPRRGMRGHWVRRGAGTDRACSAQGWAAVDGSRSRGKHVVAIIETRGGGAGLGGGCGTGGRGLGGGGGGGAFGVVCRRTPKSSSGGGSGEGRWWASAEGGGRGSSRSSSGTSSRSSSEKRRATHIGHMPVDIACRSRMQVERSMDVERVTIAQIDACTRVHMCRGPSP